MLGLNATSPGTLPSNVAKDFSASPASSLPSYYSNDLIRRPAAQTGAQLPFNTAQQSMIPAPTIHVGDLSLYDTSHNTSYSTTTSLYEASMS